MAIKYVDEVQTYQTEEELEGLINFYQPDIRILGDDFVVLMPERIEQENIKLLLNKLLKKTKVSYSICYVDLFSSSITNKCELEAYLIDSINK